MSDYRIEILAQLTGFEECKSQIKSLLSLGKEGIQIPVNLVGVDGKNSSYNKFSKQFFRGGTKAGAAYGKGIISGLNAAKVSPAIKDIVKGSIKDQIQTKGITYGVQTSNTQITTQNARADKKTAKAFAKQQANIMNALISNWSVADDSLKSSIHRAENELSDYQKYLLNSIAAFQTKLQSLSNVALNSYIEKADINTKTSLLSSRNNVLDTTGEITSRLPGGPESQNAAINLD